MSNLKDTAREIARCKGLEVFDVMIGVAVAVVLLSFWFGIENYHWIFVFVVAFGFPLVASVAVIGISRRRYGYLTVAKAGTSLILATGIYKIVTGGAQLASFYLPFIGAEFRNAREWGGYGPIEAVPYVVEGVVWSYDMVRVVLPSASTSFEIGTLLLIVGAVFEAIRRGISRKVKT